MSKLFTAEKLATGAWVVVVVREEGKNFATADIVESSDSKHIGMEVHLRPRLGFLVSLPPADLARLQVGSRIRLRRGKARNFFAQLEG